MRLEGMTICSHYPIRLATNPLVRQAPWTFIFVKEIFWLQTDLLISEQEHLELLSLSLWGLGNIVLSAGGPV